MGVQMFVIILLFVSVGKFRTNGEKQKTGQLKHGTGGLSDMAKVKLLFTQTRYDQSNMWTECREVEVDLPDWITERYDNFEWHVTGMIKQEVE